MEWLFDKICFKFLLTFPPKISSFLGVKNTYKQSEPLNIRQIVQLITGEGCNWSVSNCRDFAKLLSVYPEKEIYVADQSSIAKFLTRTFEAWKSKNGRNAKCGKIINAIEKLGLYNQLEIFENIDDETEVIFNPPSFDCDKENLISVLVERTTRNYSIEIENIQENPFVTESTIVQNMINYYVGNKELEAVFVGRCGVPQYDQNGKVIPRPLRIKIQPYNKTKDAEELINNLTEIMRNDPAFSEHGFVVHKIVDN